MQNTICELNRRLEEMAGCLDAMDLKGYEALNRQYSELMDKLGKGPLMKEYDLLRNGIANVFMLPLLKEESVSAVRKFLNQAEPEIQREPYVQF